MIIFFQSNKGKFPNYEFFQYYTPPPGGGSPKIVCGGIRGHRPKSSLGDKILAIREGDYKNCFREGEGKHVLGYRKDTGRKFSFSRFFPQKY